MSDPSMVKLAVPGTQPEYHFPPYVSLDCAFSPHALVLLPETLTERTGAGIWAWFPARAG